MKYDKCDSTFIKYIYICTYIIIPYIYIYIIIILYFIAALNIFDLIVTDCCDNENSPPYRSVT